MARLPFPDAGSRLALGADGRPAVNKVGTVYTDAAGTTLADVRQDSGGSAGAAYSGSQLTTDAFGYLPYPVWGPTGDVDRLYITVNGGPLWPIDADNNARLDAVVVTAGAAETPAGAQAKADAAAAGSLPRAGGTATGPVTFQSTAVGGPDLTDTTSRVTVESYQTNGGNFFGEGLRLDLKKHYSKNMIAWRLPRPVSGDKLTYVTNGGFETDTSGWTLVGAPTSFAVSGTQHTSGNNSGKLTYATGGSATQGVSQSVTGLVVGHTYTFVCWVFVPAGAPAVRLDIDGAGATAVSTVNDTWQELSLSWTATATSHLIRAVNHTAATSGQFVYLDTIYVQPSLSGLRSVTWVGAHYQAQDLQSVHGHWSIEVPNAADQLFTRFGINFCDSAGNIGLDKTLVFTNDADLVVNSANNQRLRFWSGPGQEKLVEFGNDQWGAAPRWMFGQNGTFETGSDAGSDFEVRRFHDNGTSAGSPVIVNRQSGRVTFGGNDGSQSGVTINRNGASGSALQVSTTATGGTQVNCRSADTTSIAVAVGLTSDGATRLSVFADGKMSWGDGNTLDVSLYRGGGHILRTDDTFLAQTDGSRTNFQVKATAVGTASQTLFSIETTDVTKRAMDYRLTGDSVSRFKMDASLGSGGGTLTFGNGTSSDTNLYRSAADTLKTDDSFHVGADLRHLGTNLGFYNAAAVAKQTVSGAKGGNAALGSLLTALAALGLVTDSTSA